MVYIPNPIKEIIGNRKYEENDVGMSESTVLMFPEYVLKIQKQGADTDNEWEMVSKLKNKLPVPGIPAYIVENGMAYTLMTRVKGKMLCDEEYLNAPERLLDLMARGLRMLWSVDVKECPSKVSPLTERLQTARYRVEHNMVDMDNVEPDTFGPDGFRDAEELLCWLEQNRPEEDIVLTHGDFCLPNLFAEEDEFSAFIDLGKMGPADRWQDLAIAIRSLKDNAAGVFTHGHRYFDFEPGMLLDRLGIPMDEEKNRYYKLLDELF